MYGWPKEREWIHINPESEVAWAEPIEGSRATIQLEDCKTMYLHQSFKRARGNRNSKLEYGNWALWLIERAALEGVFDGFLGNLKLRQHAISFESHIIDTNFTGVEGIDGHFPNPFKEEDTRSEIIRRSKAIVAKSLVVDSALVGKT